MKKAILIYTKNIKDDIKKLELYSSVEEHKPFKDRSPHKSMYHLLIVNNKDWSKICIKHKINYLSEFKLEALLPFLVKVTKCSEMNYLPNKSYVGKIMSVMIDPINDKYYSIYPPLKIQKLCHSDGNYHRTGYTYGIIADDCIKITANNLSIINEDSASNTTTEMDERVKTVIESRDSRHQIHITQNKQ